MWCGRCGENNPEEANFCGSCGEKLKPVPLSGRPRLPQKKARFLIVLLFLLVLFTYLSYLVLESVGFENTGSSQILKDKITTLKQGPREGQIDFSLVLTSPEIDSFLNEEFFKKRKNLTIHTVFHREEIEVAFSSRFLYLPTVLRLKARPEEKGGEIKLINRGMSLGRLPLPSFLYPLLCRTYPGLDFNYWLNLSGLRLKEVRLEKGQIFIRGVWPL